MKLTEAFPSNFLKVEDLKNRRVTLTLDDAKLETVGTDQKLVATFKETPKKLALNKTNANMIAMLLNSEDTDDWRGRRIILMPSMTTYQGKPTPCIRVDSELPEHSTQHATQPRPAAMAIPSTTTDPFADAADVF